MLWQPQQACCAWHDLGVATQFVEGYDWTVAISSDSPKSKDIRQITGTLIAAPLSVLRGEPHTISSMLEGVFLSILSIACGGKIAGFELRTNDIRKWAVNRSGALRELQLMEEDEIVDELKPLVHSLHDLFYPLPVDSSSVRMYCQTVTVAAFQAACQFACKNDLLS